MWKFVFKSVPRQRFHYTTNNYRLPVLESQLMNKLRDQHFNQYGLAILRQGINLYNPISTLNVSYIIHNDVVMKHRSTATQIKQACSFVNQFNDYKLLSSEIIAERLFAILYLSLHCYRSHGIRNYSNIIHYLQLSVNDYHYSMYDMPIPGEKSEDVDDFANKLVNSYYLGLENDSSKNIPSPNPSLVPDTLYLLDKYCRTNNITDYKIDDIQQWIVSINSKNIFHAQKALKRSSSIPTFVLKDFLLRQPRSAKDVHQLLKIAYSQMSLLLSSDHSQLSTPLVNLINGCISFDTKQLRPLLEQVLDKMFANIDDHSKIVLANKLIMLLSETNVRKPRNPNFYKDLINSQTQILSKLSAMIPDQKTSELITIEGYFGITKLFELAGDGATLGLLPVLENEYNKILLNVIHEQDFTRLANLSEFQKKYYANLDVSALQLRVVNLKLLLADKIEVLQKEFDQVMQTPLLIKSPQLWTSYLISLKKLKLLDEESAKELCNLYWDTVLCKFDDAKEVQIDSTFIAELIYSVKDIYFVMSLMRRLQRMKYSLNSQILIRWFSKLYSNLAFSDKRDPKTYLELLDYTRSLYKHVSLKTTPVVSTMLLGEARINPESVYELYCTELESLRKDENSIRALCLASIVLHHSNPEQPLYWGYRNEGPKPCYDVCILEFDAVRLKSVKDHLLLFPTEKLWSVYIEMLSCFHLQDQLIRVFSMFEETGFTPTEKLLLDILVNIDKNDAIRILRQANQPMHLKTPPSDIVRSELDIENLHRQSVNSSDYWPWPDMQVFVNYGYENDRKKEIQ